MAIVTGPIYTPDGTVDVAVPAAGRRDRLGASVVTQLHGKYYESMSRGNVYVASTPATGIALIVPATTGGHPTLWNPLGSGVNLSIIRVDLGYISGNNAPSTIEWALTANAGAQIVAVNGPIITFTSVAVPLALAGGSPSAAKAVWAPAVNTFLAAPVFFRTSCLSLFTGVATTAAAPFQMRSEYDGDFGVAPGNAVSLCTQQATSTALFQISIVYEEIPV